MTNETLESILNILGYSTEFINTIPKSVKCISDLTAAEIKFFSDCRNSVVNLNTPLSSRVFNNSLRHKIIRSEILEWMLTPELINIFFPQGKLVLYGAIIDRYSETIKNFEQNYVGKVPDPSEKIKRKNVQSYSLDLSFSKTDIDLTFIDCKFRGGVNFEGSNTKSLVFDRTEIGYTHNLVDEEEQSFNGKNLKVDGDLMINYVRDPHEGVNDTSAYRMTQNADKRPNQVKGIIKLHYTTITRQLNFDSLYLGKWAAIDTYSLQANSLFANSLNTESFIDLSFAKIEESLFFINCSFYGKSNAGYSFDASAVNAKDVFIRDGGRIKYGISLFTSTLRSLDLSGVFICPNEENQIAIDLRSTTVQENIIFSPRRINNQTIDYNFSTIFGKVLLDNANVKNLKLSRVRFIYKTNELTFSANDMTVNGKITFSQNIHLPSLKIDKIKGAEIKNLYSRIREKQKQYDAIVNPEINSTEQLFFQKENIEDEDIISYSEYYTYLYIYENLFELRPFEFKPTKSDNKIEVTTASDNSNEISQNQTNDIFPTELLWLKDFQKAYKHLRRDIETDILNDKWSINVEDVGDLIIETAIIIGESSFLGLICKEQFDCASAFFYGMDADNIQNHCKPDNGEFINANALSIKYATILGQLFLNEGPNKNLPFRAYGQVNLHSSKVEQFFVSPKRGMNTYVQWKLIGMKYEYIYSNEKGKVTNLEKCKWFHDYQDENNRQPYEQLALAYLKAGDDYKARRVLTRTVTRDVWDKSLMKFIKFFVWAGTPAYRALAAFLIIGLVGWFVFSWSVKNDGITVISDFATLNSTKNNNKVEFNPLSYSFQQIIPIISLDQKNMFAPNYNSGRSLSKILEINFPSKSNNNFFIDTGKLTAIYQIFHSFIGTIFLGMFIIGITRIIRRD